MMRGILAAYGFATGGFFSCLIQSHKMRKRGNGIKKAFDYALPSTKGGCIAG